MKNSIIVVLLVILAVHSFVGESRATDSGIWEDDNRIYLEKDVVFRRGAHFLYDGVYFKNGTKPIYVRSSEDVPLWLIPDAEGFFSYYDGSKHQIIITKSDYSQSGNILGLDGNLELETPAPHIFGGGNSPMFSLKSDLTRGGGRPDNRVILQHIVGGNNPFLRIYVPEDNTGGALRNALELYDDGIRVGKGDW